MVKEKLKYPYNLIADITKSKTETNTHPFDIEITMDYLLTVLSAVNSVHAEVLKYYYKDGMTETEISEELGIARVTVNKKKQKALAWLREESRMIYIQYGITGVGTYTELRGYQRGIAQCSKHLAPARQLLENSGVVM